MKKIFILAAVMVFSVSCVWRSENKSNAPNSLQIVVNNEKNAAAGGFLTLKNSWAKCQTEVFGQITDNGLRFEFFCYGEPEKTVFSAKKADDDMTLFGGDHVELQLAPDWLNSKKYYHFAVNPAGSVYHAIGHDTSWTPKDFTYSIENLKNCRKIVLEMSWQTLGLQARPAKGTVWKGNFCRAGKLEKSPVEFSSWTGAQSFHEINQMGDIIFGSNENPCLRILKCNITGSDIEIDAGVTADNKTCTFQILCNDELKFEKKLQNSDIISNKITLKNKYVPLKNKYKVTFRLLKNDAVILEKSGFIFNGSKEFMSLDKFEYLKNSAVKIQTASLPGVVTIKNDKEVFIKQNISASPALVQLKDLPEGRYVVEYESGNSRLSRVIFIADEASVKVSPLPKNVKLTVSGSELLFDNKPFYLLGISGGSKTHFPHEPGFHLRYGRGARINAPVF